MPCHMFMQNTKYEKASGLKLFLSLSLSLAFAHSLNHFTTYIHNMKRREAWQDNNNDDDEQIYAKRVFAKG